MSIDPSLYVFNDQYITQLIDKYIFELKDKLYHRSLEAQNTQKNIFSMKEYSYLLSNELDFLMSNSNDRLKYDEDKYVKNANTLYGTLMDFNINHSINNEYGFSAGTLSLKLDSSNIIPYYNKKKFLNNYGYKTVLSLLDIMSDYNTFNRRLLFSIDKYIFLMLKIIILKDGIILIIEDDSVNGISSSTLRDFMVNNKIWCLYSENQSDYYYTYKIKTNLFTSGRDVISMNQITNKKEFDKPDKINSYNILITASTSNPNLLAQSTTTIGLDLDGITKCFTVSSAYKNYIMNNSNNCYCYILNNYRKTGYSIINNLPGDENITMQIPYTTNPIYVNNINIWEYDSINDIKLEKIKNEMTQKFPNLYDLSYLPRNIDYYIDWYSANIAPIEFDNSISDYLDCYSDSYVDMIVNETAPDILLNYEPLSNFTYDYDDYLAKINNGDIREYKIIKLKELLLDDSARYSKFIKDINNTNRKYIYGSYDMSVDTIIYNRNVMSNTGQVLNSGDLVSFSEPHTYVIFSNSNSAIRTAILFVDGKRYVPTLVYTENYKTYVYIKKSLLTASSKIIIEIPIVSSSLENKHTGEFSISKINEKVNFPTNIFSKISGNNLIFYNSSTLDYYDKSIFQLSGNFKVTSIKNSKNEVLLQIMSSDEYVYFIVKVLNYFTMVGNERLAVQEEFISVVSNLLFNKNIPTDNLFITSSEGNLLNVDISVTNTDTPYTIEIPEISESPLGIFNVFKEDPNENRFRVYVNGIIVNDNTYSYTPPNKYMDNATFEITSYTQNDTNKILNNLISNEGNFEGTDLNYWTVLSGPTTGKVALSTLQYKTNSKSLRYTLSNTGVALYKDIAATASNKIYCCTYIKKISGTATTASVRLFDYGTTANGVDIASNINSASNWTFYSGIKTVNSGGTTGVRLYLNTTSSQTVEYYIDTLILLNLTTIYGAGNEPSKSTMDTTIQSIITSSGYINQYVIGSNSAIIDYLPYKEKTLIDSQITSNKIWWRESEINNMNMNIKFITYGNGKFIAIPNGITNIYYMSSNGTKWTPYTLPVSLMWSGIYYVNNRFILISYGNTELMDVLATGVWNDNSFWEDNNIWSNQPNIKICSSEDGINWIGNVTSSEGYWLDNNTWNDDNVWNDDPEHSIYLIDNGNLYSSEGYWVDHNVWNDSAIWNDGIDGDFSYVVNSLYPINSLVYANNLYVAISNNKIIYSEDMYNWYIASFNSESYGWNDIAYGNGKFIAVSNLYDKIAISENGMLWVESDIPFTTLESDISIVFGKDKFIISGYSNSYIRESADGITWAQRSIPHPINKGKIVYGNNRYAYISSDNQYAILSNDAITWSTFTLANVKLYNDISYGNGKFLSIGYSEGENNISTFTNGKPILYHDNLLDLTLLADNPFDKNNTRVYVNGLRKSNDDIIETKFTNVIKINGYTPSDTLRIDVIESDEDCYDYNENKDTFLHNELLALDSTFNSYINDNY